MKPIEVIEQMQELHKANPDQELIVAWWDREAFSFINQEDWNEKIDFVESKFDWSYTHDALAETFNYLI